MHDALVQAGYDRTFEEVAPDNRAPAALPARCGGVVTVDRARGDIGLETGVHLDLGGIGKGYAVDRDGGHPLPGWARARRRGRRHRRRRPA